MATNQLTNAPAGAVLEVSAPPRVAVSGLSGRLARNLETIAAFFLFLFVIAQPVSIGAAHIAYAGAGLAWVLRLALVRRGALKSSPLDLPILIYLVLCAASTLLSPLPISSWEGMRKVALIFLVLVVAHNVANARRAKQLLAGLFFFSLAPFSWAGWGDAHGVGFALHNSPPGPPFFSPCPSANDAHHLCP